MSEDKVYKNLAKFVKVESKVYGQNPPKLEVTYTRPNYQEPTKEAKVGQFETKLDVSVVDRILGLSIGDDFCIHTKKAENGFMELVDVTDAKDAPTKSETQSKYKKSEYKPADKSGEAVGGAFKYAIDILAHKLKLEDVLALVDQIVPAAEERKKKLKAIHDAENKANNPDAKKEEDKPLSLLEQRKLEKEKALAAEAAAKETKKEEPKKTKAKPAPEPEEDQEDDEDPKFDDVEDDE